MLRLTRWALTLTDVWRPGQQQFPFCTSLSELFQWLLTVKEVTQVTTPNSLKWVGAVLVLCPARTRLPARNSLVNEVEFVYLHSSTRAGRKMFWSLLGYIVTKVCASPRNLTWFTRPFLLVRGWGLGTRLGQYVAKSLQGGAHAPPPPLPAPMIGIVHMK